MEKADINRFCFIQPQTRTIWAFSLTSLNMTAFFPRSQIHLYNCVVSKGSGRSRPPIPIIPWGIERGQRGHCLESTCQTTRRPRCVARAVFETGKAPSIGLLCMVVFRWWWFSSWWGKTMEKPPLKWKPSSSPWTWQFLGLIFRDISVIRGIL